MTDDQVKAALDEWRAAKTVQQYNAAAVKLLSAIADRIEALEADVARLKADLTLVSQRSVADCARWVDIAADERARAEKAEARVARLEAASVITGPGEAALREAIAFAEGTIEHTLASRAGGSRAFTIIKSLNAILSNLGKEEAPDADL